MIAWELFHFLRPAWLLALPVVTLLWWIARRAGAGKFHAAEFVAPHLRDALTVNQGGTRGFLPADGVALAIAVLTIAAAGPTWSRQPSPWFAETSPLVVAIEVSDSMRSNDLQPSRLDRARFKLLDLIARRTGSRTALIAYGGSAHIVMPPTRDIEVFKPFLESLDPVIMPEPGADAALVLPLARKLLGDGLNAGNLLFINDGFDPADIPALREFAREPGSPSVVALVVGTEEGGVALMPDGSPVFGVDGGRLDTRVDAPLLQRVAGQADVSIVRATTDHSDLRRLLRVIESNLQQADDPDARWRDQGWFLLWPALVLVLLWFRRGWTMQWT